MENENKVNNLEVANEEVSKTEKVNKTERTNKNDRRNNRNNKRRPNNRPSKTYDEIVLDTKAVVKVTKGGRQRRFQAVVLVGDKKGLVGLGIGKANEISEAVKKARQDAQKNIVKVSIVDNRTIAHEMKMEEGATRVVLKPASAGTGLVAGSAVRSVLEIAGYRDIISKSLGARSKINMARATINALLSIKTIEQVCEERGKTREEILG
jgi:small subunit ribosomal protein S5